MTEPKNPLWAQAVLSVAEMGQADRAATDGGVTSAELMENAGAAVAEAVRDIYADPFRRRGNAVILCGPGNNGGDGFVAARLLAAEGWNVRAALLGEVEAMPPDAKANAEEWTRRKGETHPLTADAVDGPGSGEAEGGLDVVVDALFGAGLTRDLDGVAREVVERMDARRRAGDLKIVAADMPSGIDGDTGQVRGAAAHADTTVTFFRPKPAHLMLPGRAHCGKLVVADIGIPDAVLEEIGPTVYANDTALWAGRYPWPALADHKYSRGMVLINGGAVLTGAARLASHAALRAGAGIVTVASPPAAAAIYRGGHAGVTVRDIADDAAFAQAVAEARIGAILLGPGNGVGEETRARVTAALATGKPCVLDADALTSFEEDTDALLTGVAANGKTVLTPHDGEFKRLFGGRLDMAMGKLELARAAAQAAGGVVLYKGADTVIAAPGGRAAINTNAPPELATAGSGDVLAGFIVALLAQGMEPFDAACAGAWLHGDAARRFGPGLIAEDLADMLPPVLRELKDQILAARGPGGD